MNSTYSEIDRGEREEHFEDIFKAVSHHAAEIFTCKVRKKSTNDEQTFNLML